MSTHRPSRGRPPVPSALRDGLGRALRWTQELRRTLVVPLVDLVLPEECGGCRRPGARWCARCGRDLEALAFGVGLAHRVVPGRAPPDLPVVHAWGPYAGPLRHAVPAWKDDGRRDLAAVLAPLLAAAVGSAVREAGWHGSSGEPVLLVPVPSSRAAVRARGDVPLLALAARAAALLDRGATSLGGTPLRVAPALVHGRAVLDQSRLDRATRRANLAGAHRVPTTWRPAVRGRRCVLVDDVVTTGATLAEAARALRAAGAAGVVAATVAATPAPTPRRRA